MLMASLGGHVTSMFTIYYVTLQNTTTLLTSSASWAIKYLKISEIEILFQPKA